MPAQLDGRHLPCLRCLRQECQPSPTSEIRCRLGIIRVWSRTLLTAVQRERKPQLGLWLRSGRLPDISFDSSLWNREPLVTSSDAGVASDYSSSPCSENGTTHSQASWIAHSSFPTTPASATAAAESMWETCDDLYANFPRSATHAKKKWAPNPVSSINHATVSWSATDSDPVLTQDWVEEDFFGRDVSVAGPADLPGSGKVDPFASCPTKLPCLLVAGHTDGKSPAQRFKAT